MQIVIDIPKEAYEIIKKDTESEMYIIQVIKQGIPLSENHGRLIDADAIKQKYPLMYNDFGMEFNNGIHEALDEAPTILESTRGKHKCR